MFQSYRDDGQMIIKDASKGKISVLPYFFGYKSELFSFKNNPKNLAPSYKTNLDL